MASGSTGAKVTFGKAGKGRPTAAKGRKGRYKPDFSKLSPDTDSPF